MSSQDIPEENLPAEQDHAHGAVSVADEKNPFADPGLPPHEHRIQDIDERAAKRSERVVALLFTVSMLATVGFIASYVTIPKDKAISYSILQRLVRRWRWTEETEPDKIEAAVGALFPKSDW
ncbi:hypothetical protein ABZ372_33720, partial [Streptomyces sp. NPDC005921]